MKLKEFPGKRVPQEPSRWTVTKENNVDKMQNSKYANRKIQTFLSNPPSNTIKNEKSKENAENRKNEKAS